MQFPRAKKSFMNKFYSYLTIFGKKCQEKSYDKIRQNAYLASFLKQIYEQKNTLYNIKILKCIKNFILFILLNLNYRE